MPGLLAWIRYAIDFEQRFIDFYKDCLVKVEDDLLSEVFKFLIGEEARHKMVLEKALKWSAAGKDEDLKKSVKEYMDFKVKVPIFSEDASKKISHPDEVNEILNKAMAFEKKGFAFYVDLAKKEKDADIKRFLTRLANDERTHVEIIKTFGQAFI